MLFTRVDRESRFSASGRRRAFLVDDGWDDFNFKTMFKLILFDDEGAQIEFGGVKILLRGLGSGRVFIPETFTELGPEYCSLGQEQNYYETAAALPGDLGDEVLGSLRDCVRDQRIFLEFRNEPGFQDSLLRFVPEETIKTKFVLALKGQANLVPFRFVYVYPQHDQKAKPPYMSFEITPISMPPTNVHVVIGRNGVGKTHLLRNIASVLYGGHQDDESSRGRIRFASSPGAELRGRFANLVAVSFSAFDPFTEPDADVSSISRIRYAYVGLKSLPKLAEKKGTTRRGARTKELPELATEFSESLGKCLTGPRRHRWLSAIRTLEADPGFRELDIMSHLENGKEAASLISRLFETLSAGHKIVLLTVTRLVELAEERTLILFDEPEAHLHPPLLSSLVRVLSDLLSLRNSVAIVSTHSPVVLQEVPKSCVWLLRRSGETVNVERPEIETFGENVGVLTREVFGLEVTNSGFHNLISAQAASTQGNYNALLRQFGQQLGAEARGIARTLPSPKDEE